MAYTKINFQNLPNTTTPINATNMNALQTNVENALAEKANTNAIPTVNNSTITIQKNSSTVDSFTTNASSNKTINISVPTKTSDLTNDSGFMGSDFMMILNNADQTIKGNNTAVKYSLNTNSISSGNKLTFDSTNHAINIGAGVSYIEATAMVYVFTRGANSVVQVYIYKNDTQVSRVSESVLGDYTSIVIPPIPISVQQNDKISVYIRSSAGTNTNVVFGGNADGIDFLSVKVIK